MCGIVGFFQPRPQIGGERARTILKEMRDRLRHRGPDDAGLWLDQTGLIALGHRRLSILDLSPEGHQPMHSPDGRYVLVYNGEIYNYLDVRRELEQSGHRFRGSSDTEVLLAAISHWSLEDTLPRLNGMFALALWDRKLARLALARDRYGKKPLYYGKVGPVWAFASELKALKALPDFSGTLNQQSLLDYFRFGYFPSPQTVYEGLSKLEPASYCWFEVTGPGLIQKYWKLPDLSLAPPDVSLAELEGALLKAVKVRMASDVPLGAFLSGGIDSSLVVALMQEQSLQPIRTFSLGFRSASYDEAVHARKVAARLGTEHTEHYVDAQEALAVVPRLSELFDEPFADSSQIPMYLVSRLARTSVTVALSGDGGDEVFGGYNRYLLAPRIWRYLRSLPLPLRRLLSFWIAKLPTGALAPFLGGRLAYPHAKLTKLSSMLSCVSQADLYRSLVSQWQEPRQLLPHLLDRPAHSGLEADFVDWMMRRDALTYLPDDILVKVDRASMAVSLEARAPLLDWEVAELAWRMPVHQKIKRGTGKWPLRQMLHKRLPAELFDRPKAGFSLPLGDWLRHELRDWSEDLLSQVRRAGLLHFKAVEKLWRQHLAGHRDWSAPLWTVLMFQAWSQDQRN